jgi:hypothetical protein
VWHFSRIYPTLWENIGAVSSHVTHFPVTFLDILLVYCSSSWRVFFGRYENLSTGKLELCLCPKVRYIIGFWKLRHYFVNSRRCGSRTLKVKLLIIWDILGFYCPILTADPIFEWYCTFNRILKWPMWRTEGSQWLRRDRKGCASLLLLKSWYLFFGNNNLVSGSILVLLVKEFLKCVKVHVPFGNVATFCHA